MFIAIASLLALLATALGQGCSSDSKGRASGRVYRVDPIPDRIPEWETDFRVYIPSECNYHQGTSLTVCADFGEPPNVHLRNLNHADVGLTQPTSGRVSAIIYCADMSARGKRPRPARG